MHKKSNRGEPVAEGSLLLLDSGTQFLHDAGLERDRYSVGTVTESLGQLTHRGL